MAKKRLMLGVALLLVVGLIVIHIKPFTQKSYLKLSSSQSDFRPVATMEIVMPTGEIDINSADAVTLQQLHGIGVVLSERIVEERESNGIFSYPADLMAVSGIGEKTLEGLLPYITLDADGGTYAK